MSSKRAMKQAQKQAYAKHRSNITNSRFGLKKRKDDLLDRVDVELNWNENNILENTDLKNIEELPDAVSQEEKLDEKKRKRENLGSVNLRADEETNKYEKEIKSYLKKRK